MFLHVDVGSYPFISSALFLLLFVKKKWQHTLILTRFTEKKTSSMFCAALYPLTQVVQRQYYSTAAHWKLKKCPSDTEMKLNLDSFGVSCLVLEISAVEISAFSLI